MQPRASFADRLLVRVAHARELLDLSGRGLAVEALWVAASQLVRPDGVALLPVAAGAALAAGRGARGRTLSLAGRGNANQSEA